MLSQARCTATSDDEQAVSTTMLGPWKSKQYEMRLATMLKAVPVAEYELTLGLVWDSYCNSE